MHNLIKFHPDWDQILERIAQNDGDDVFLLTGKDSLQSIQLKNRWRESAPTFLAKCRFFGHLQQDKYFSLLACSDIVLDPIHMGCGTTLIDASINVVPHPICIGSRTISEHASKLKYLSCCRCPKNLHLARKVGALSLHLFLSWILWRLSFPVSRNTSSPSFCAILSSIWSQSGWNLIKLCII